MKRKNPIIRFIAAQQAQDPAYCQAELHRRIIRWGWDLSQSTLSKWANDKATPPLPSRLALRDFSGGQIPVEDW
jgi:hypothetical protein